MNTTNTPPTQEKAAYRVRFQRHGLKPSYKTFRTLEMAQEQLGILNNDILHKVRTKLYNRKPSHILRTTVVEEKSENRKRGRLSHFIKEVEMTVSDFIQDYIKGKIRKDERTFTICTESRGGMIGEYNCTSEAVYEAICHMKGYLDPKVTSLKNWNEQNLTDAATMETDLFADYVEKNISGFEVTSEVECDICDLS